MAKEFVLHINIENISSTKSKAQDKLESTTNSSGKAVNPIKQAKKDVNKFKKAMKATGAGYIALQAINTAQNAKSYLHGTIGSKYGDTARQNQVQNIENGIGIGTSIAGAAIAGGVALGPIGLAIGAVVGVASQAIQMIERTAEWNRQQFKNNLNEVRSSERLGLMRSDRNRR